MLNLLINKKNVNVEAFKKIKKWNFNSREPKKMKKNNYPWSLMDTPRLEQTLEEECIAMWSLLTQGREFVQYCFVDKLESSNDINPYDDAHLSPNIYGI